MKTFTILAMVLASGQVQTPAHQGPREFDSAADAAIYATRFAYSVTPYYESGGVITRLPDGKFLASFPETDYRGAAVGIDEDYTSYEGQYPIVADYHTHACLPVSHVPGVFSPADIHSARETMRPSYMADFCTGKVHLFDPAVDKVETMIDMDLVTAGRIVGNFPVTGTSLDKTGP